MTPTPDRKELDDLKARVDLVELFRRHGLEPKKRGKNWTCRCPFHDDENASLSINSERRLWKCFGCTAAGDAFDFLRLKEKLEFPEALVQLRALAGTVPAPIPGTGNRPSDAELAALRAGIPAQPTHVGAVMTAQGLGAIVGAPIGGWAYQGLVPLGRHLGLGESFGHYSPLMGTTVCVLLGWLISLRILRDP